MALWRSKGARKDATRGTAPIEVRKSDALMFTGTGVVPGSASPLVTGTSGWAYNVGKAGFVTSRGESDGAHFFGNDGVAATPAVPVAPGPGLSRIDIIWVRHPANGENSDTDSRPVFGVTSGTAASTPIAPTIPTGATELARNTMSSGAISTASAGNSIAQTAATVRSRLAPYRLVKTVRPGSATGSAAELEVAIFETGPFVSPGGHIRVTASSVSLNPVAAPVGALFTVRLRLGSPTGALIGAASAHITQIVRNTPVPPIICDADVTRNSSTSIYLTVQRIDAPTSGQGGVVNSGSVVVSNDAQIVVDEDPV